MPEHETVALVGAAGGVGTTRLTLETAATLARDGRDVIVLDTALETQGLVDHVPGTMDADAASLYTEDAVLSETLVELDLPVGGELAVCPARAPFERLARASTAAAAQQVEHAMDEACSVADHVLVDVPPIASNPAVAAVTTADQVGVVTTATSRGQDALQQLRARLNDVGTESDVTIVNRADAPAPIESADVTVPGAPSEAPTATPTVVDPDPSFAPAVATAAETLVETTLDLDFPDAGPLPDLR